MIIVCQHCQSRLQVDSEKSPSGALKVRCPKCKNTVNVSNASPATDQSAFTVGGSPATEHPRYDQPTAQAYTLSTVQEEKEVGVNEQALAALVDLLGKGMAKAPGSNGVRRKALVCTSEAYREQIARSLTENGYQAFIAEDTRQAVETMRSNQMELVLLESQFDVAEQGVVFIVREVNMLRPSQRRRLFFVLISPALRTMDAHSAFLNNVNAIVNTNDVRDIPRILEVAFREYNELYRDLNHALNLSEL